MFCSSYFQFQQRLAQRYELLGQSELELLFFCRAFHKSVQQWLLSLDTSLDGQYGETDSYPHYSIFFSEDNSQIAKEHFTCAQKVRFKLDHNLGRLENATRNFNSQIKVQILPEHPEIDPATLEPYL